MGGAIPTHSGPAWNYRNQAQFKVAKGPDGAAALGFFEAESNKLIPIDACPILSPRLNALLAILRSEPWISELANGREVELLADDRDEKVMLTLTGNWSAQQSETLARRCLDGLAGVSTVAFANDAGGQVFGEPHLTYRIGQFTYRISPTAFFQSARFLLPEFVTAVVPPVSASGGADRNVGAESPEGKKTGGLAIDLFAGVGLFTLPLGNPIRPGA